MNANQGTRILKKRTVMFGRCQPVASKHTGDKEVTRRYDLRVSGRVVFADRLNRLRIHQQGKKPACKKSIVKTVAKNRAIRARMPANKSVNGTSEDRSENSNNSSSSGSQKKSPNYATNNRRTSTAAPVTLGTYSRGTAPRSKIFRYPMSKISNGMALTTPSVELPNSLNDVKCRRTPMKNMMEFIFTCLDRDYGGAGIICGPPGTGKTYVVQTLVRQMQDKLPPKMNNPVYINCMALMSECDLVKAVCTSLQCRALSNLDSLSTHVALMASRDNANFTLLVMDELDYAYQTHRDTVLSIIDIFLSKQSPVILIGISNSIDLVDEISNRLRDSSKKALKMIIFLPYNREEIEILLRAEIPVIVKDTGIEFTDSAITWCAAKFAGSVGDYRKAIDKCCRAVDEASRSGLSKIDTEDIAQVVAAATDQSILPDSRLFQLPLVQRLLIMTCAYLGGVGDESVNPKQAFEIYCQLCTQMSSPINSMQEFWEVADALQSHGIISISGKGSCKQKIHLKVSPAIIRVRTQRNPLLRHVNDKLCKIAENTIVTRRR